MYETTEQISNNDMELVPFATDSHLHIEDIFELSEKGGDPTGYEQLQEDGCVLVSFAKREPNSLSQEDFDCLKAYYHRVYETPLEVSNIVQKLKKVKVLGYVYRSRLTGRDKGTHIYAYRPDNFESDDLDGVLNIGNEEHLRAGTVEYFFFHQTVYRQDNECLTTNHCLAFVSWYKNPRLNSEALATGTSETNRPFRKEYEVKSSYSILPVHKLYTPIHIRHLDIDNIFIALGLTRMFL